MPIDIAERRDNAETQTFTLLVCPNWVDGECRCERDGDGNPTPGHSMYHYAAAPPEGMGDSAEQWDQRARQHAIAIETVSQGGQADPDAVLLAAAPEASSSSSSDQVAGGDRAELEQLRRTRRGSNASDR